MRPTYVAFAAFALSLCLPAQAAKIKAAKQTKPRELWVAFTSNVVGRIYFCETCPHTFGAMAHKAAMFARWRKELGGPLLVLDAGNCLNFGGGPKAAPVMLKIMDLCKYAAANVGDDEAAFGPQVMRSAARGTNVQWLSCNVRLASGSALFPASTVVNAGGLRVAVIGVLDREALRDGFSPSRDLRVEDGLECVMQEAKRLSGKYDVLIILAHAPPERLIEYARAVPQAALVAGGSTVRPAPEPQMVGSTLVFQPQVYSVARVRLVPKAGRYTAAERKRVPVYSNAPTDPDVVRIVEDFQRHGG
jgi:2',3'-cyclic-nucleotide 2'-phosphodiesterase (5'-nucleotidase family)